MADLKSLLAGEYGLGGFAPPRPSPEEMVAMREEAGRLAKEYDRTALTFDNFVKQVSVAGSPSDARSGAGYGRKGAAKHLAKILEGKVRESMHPIPPVPVRAAGETPPHLQGGPTPERVAVQGLHEPMINPELERGVQEALIVHSLREALGGQSPRLAELSAGLGGNQ